MENGKQDKRESVIPEKLLINKSDVEKICSQYIYKRNTKNIIIQIVLLISGFGLSYLSSFLYNLFQGEALLGIAHIPFLFFVIVIIVAILIIYNLNSAKKSDLLESIYENVIENSDHTAIFIISKNTSKDPATKDIQLLTCQHGAGGEPFIVFKKLNDKEHYDIEELKQYLITEFGIAKNSLIELSPKGSFNNIKRTSDTGNEKLISYDFFTVKIKKSAEKKVNHNNNYEWMSLDFLLKDINSQIYNHDVIQYIRENYYSELGNSFISENSIPPKKIIWNITSKCELDCEICATHDMGQKRIELSEDEKARALLSLLSIGEDNIIGIDFSGGDPLLCDSSKKIIKYAIQELGGEKVSVTTTGYGIKKAHDNNADLVSALRNWEITIETVDDLSPVRGVDKYSSNNLYYISLFKDDITNLIINVPIVDPKMSDEKIKELVDRISKINIDSKKVTLIKLMKVGRNQEYDYSGYDPSEFIKIFLGYAQDKFEVKLQCALRTEFGVDGLKSPTCSCNMLNDKIGVDCAGNVFSCAWGGYIKIKEGEGVENNPYYLGNLLSMDLSDILKNQKTFSLDIEITNEKWDGKTHCPICQ